MTGLRGPLRCAAALGAVAFALAGAACRKAPPKRTLEVLVPFLPATLDPFADSRLVSRSIFTAVYEPLAEESAYGSRPAVAESWTNPSPDTWAFRISGSARFHDGSPVTSRDVVDAARASRAARGSLAGLADLKTIEIVDERTVRFVTHQPAEDFLLTVSLLFISRREGEAWQGTGPFRVVARAPDRILLMKHPRPHRPAPHFDEIVFRRFTSPADGVRLLGRPQPAAVLDPHPAMVAEARGDPRYRIQPTESGGLTYLAVGLSDGTSPLADVRVRRALRLSLDLPRLAKEGTVSGGTPAAQLVPPGSFGYDPKRTPPKRDLAEARRLLALAGYPNGFDGHVDVNPNGRLAGEAVARQAAEAGIRLDVAVHAPDEFVAHIQEGSPLYLYSWFVGKDAGQALRNGFHTRDVFRALGTLNRTGYSSPAVDRCFAELSSATRPEERLGKLREISGLLDAELPWIPLYSAQETRILPAGLSLPRRLDGLFVVSEARPAGGGN